jgi:catechol 2,3-dioxygenase
MRRPIDPRVQIGHVHLKVADLDRAIAFYSDILGFEVTQRHGDAAAFLGAGGYHHHIGLNTWESRNGPLPPAGTTGLYHLAIRYPDRRALGDALRRLREAGVPLEGASDHGVSEAVYLRDPDGNGVELSWDHPREQWPRAPDGSLRMTTEPLDLDALLAEAAQPPDQPTEAPAPPVAEGTRVRLRDLRAGLLHLHKALLDDARAAYELDRGRVGSAGNLLQLVINDPWFAWLHPLSELLVRIDETLEGDAPASEEDGMALLEQAGRLLVPSESGQGFPLRYFEALQRQPAVVLAHSEVRRMLRAG